ncbi:hypothetical protein [Longimicrobium sp.]|uniref:hypothetical protein n=1 Tax=Longimicrobium sp. TaxID=2029185 RepID=UPI002B64A898|nr:hypothetical protein [Longimicrobium sp.]HSU15677.1 hypothetical protein [Longimicrobium sp.]
MQKIRLDLDALVAESFALAAPHADGEGMMEAYGAGQTRNCATPLCTAGTSCL